jgi:CRP/FNR family transcriptional regulator, cyclic AMP receptor protein
MTTSRIELLQGMPIFGALREDLLAFLLDLMSEHEVPATRWVVREGDAAASLFVLERGRASVLKGWEGRKVRLGRLGAGDCFGEMALMDLMPRSAGVRADTDCHVLELAQADLARVAERDLEQFALLQMNLGREVSRRLRRSDQMLFELTMARGDACDFDGDGSTDAP